MFSMENYADDNDDGTDKREKLNLIVFTNFVSLF